MVWVVAWGDVVSEELGWLFRLLQIIMIEGYIILYSVVIDQDV